MLATLTNIRSSKVLLHASCIMHHASSIMYCKQKAEIWYVDCSHKYKMNQGVMVGGSRPLVEDDLWWKTTFVGRRPLLEDDLRWEDDLQWKTTFSGRQPSMEDSLRVKMTQMEDGL